MTYEIRIDVSKIDKASLYKGAKGNYLTLQVIETPKSEYGTHMVKQVLSKEAYSALTEEQRKAIPILGNMKPSKFQPVETVVAEEVTRPQEKTQVADPLENSDQLPF
jgi:hypothetical protein